MDKVSDFAATPNVGAALMSDPEICSVLNGLIETCKDGQLGYEQATTEVHLLSLKPVFGRFAAQRGEFVRELQAQVYRLGGDPERGGTVVGAVKQGWNDFKAALGARSDHAILEGCERGEDVSKEDYREANNMMLPPEVQSLVARQYQAVREAHDEIRILRDHTV